MNQATGVLSFVATAVIAAIGGVASSVTFAQAPPAGPAIPNAMYVAKAAFSDCGPAVVTMRGGIGIGAGIQPLMPPIGGPVQMRKLSGAQPPTKTGAPYSAVGTTEIIQTLADGNRIVHTNTSHVYRDSSGRVRTEMSLSAVGPFTLDTTSTVATINDPVAKQMLVLHPEQKRADVMKFNPVGSATATGASRQESGSVIVGGKAEAVQVPDLPPLPPIHCTSAATPTTVSLGQKTLDGLTATGTRMEYTIAAGQIGNEQPITVTSEQWVNEDLGLVLSSTQHDPMIGDTQFHLSQIDRTEPDPSLFVVPADYTVSDLTMNKAVIVAHPVPPG